MRNSGVSFEPVEPILASIERQHGEIRYVRYTEKNWRTAAFLLFWLGGWTVAGYFAVGKLYSPIEQFDKAFLLFWLLGWALGWCGAVSALIWTIFGKQTIIANHAALTKIDQVGPLKRTRMFRPSNIKSLRWVDTHSVNDSEGTTRESSSIKFDYGAKTVTVFKGISHPEASQLISELCVTLNVEGLSK